MSKLKELKKKKKSGLVMKVVLKCSLSKYHWRKPVCQTYGISLTNSTLSLVCYVTYPLPFYVALPPSLDFCLFCHCRQPTAEQNGYFAVLLFKLSNPQNSLSAWAAYISGILHFMLFKIYVGIREFQHPMIKHIDHSEEQNIT